MKIQNIKYTVLIGREKNKLEFDWIKLHQWCFPYEYESQEKCMWTSDTFESIRAPPKLEPAMAFE